MRLKFYLIATLILCFDIAASAQQSNLNGKVKGKENPNGGVGLNLVISDYGVRINYNEKAIKY
jgi:hypothetical protein